jgi:hypothetical protein
MKIFLVKCALLLQHHFTTMTTLITVAVNICMKVDGPRSDTTSAVIKGATIDLAACTADMTLPVLCWQQMRCVQLGS